MSTDSGADPQALRAEIAQTRDELGTTVERLAAKTDVKARAKDAAGQAADRVKETAGQAADRVKETAGQAADRVKETAGQAADQVRQQVADLPPAARRTLRPAMIVAAVALVAAVVYLARRRRS